MTARAARVVFGLAIAAIASCGAAAPMAERGPPASRWSYVFGLDPGLTRLRATVCFEGPAPYALAPIDPLGRRYLRAAVGPDGAPLERAAGLLVTAGLPAEACVRYEVDLGAAARDGGGLQGASRLGDDLVVSTAVWLWAPMRREDASASAVFELPPGVQASPLWPRGPDGRARLDERAFRFSAYAAFGRVETRSVPVPGGCVHVSVLGDDVEMGADAITRCFARAATASSMLFGRLPEPEIGLLAVPTPFSSSSPFGVVGRGSLPTVAILVGERATEDRLSRAWVPVHELAHLATPFIERRDAWLSEGLATYYQEVLRARAGLLSPDEAWANLVAGLARSEGDGTGRTLADESRDMMETASFRRVYWGGAAIALMADVELRRRSGSARSLDDGLEALQRCCPNGEAIGAEEAMARIDGDGPPVFRRVAQRALASRSMPDTAPTLRALGIERSPDGGLRFGGDASARALREAIMAPRAELAPMPARCAR